MNSKYTWTLNASTGQHYHNVRQGVRIYARLRVAKTA